MSVGNGDAPRSSARSRSRSASAICFEVDEGDDCRRVRVARDLDPSEPGSITEVDRNARAFDGALPELRLPGSGKRYDTCGDDQPLLACPECWETTTVGQTCRRSQCPRCWQSWDFDRALDAGTALEGERRYRYTLGETKTKLHHLTVSFPASLRFARADPLDAGFKLVYRLLGEVGVDAGYVMYHPWRIVKEYRGEVNGHSSGEGDMTWAEILTKVESDEWSWDAVRDEFLTYAPHFHAVVNATFVQGGAVTEAVENQTGVVIHRITEGDSSVSIGNIRDLAATTAYAVSHAGLAWDDDNDSFRAAARKFGSTANVERRRNVKDDVDAALRKVVPDVLGVDFTPPQCDSEVVETHDDAASGAGHDHEHGHGHAPVGSGRSPSSTDDRNELTDTFGFPTGPRPAWSSGSTGGYATDGGTWGATRGVSPEYLDDPGEADDDLRKRCGGKLAPIWAAEGWLADDDQVADHDPATVADLQADLDAFHERGGRPAAPPPGAEDPPSPPD